MCLDHVRTNRISTSIKPRRFHSAPDANDLCPSPAWFLDESEYPEREVVAPARPVDLYCRGVVKSTLDDEWFFVTLRFAPVSVRDPVSRSHSRIARLWCATPR